MANTPVVHHGDCLDVLRTLPDASVDAVVTDPPYELTGKSGRGGFMGKAWDASGIAYDVDMWRECLRVLRPGGHLVAFGGTRTYHRMTCAIEDAGFEIRNSLQWIYGSGFPKSLDVSKAIDKAAGAEREVVGQRAIHYADTPSGYTSVSAGGGVRPGGIFDGSHGERAAGRDVTAPATDAARQWSGWGTALKPAVEPLVLARRPLAGTGVAANVLAHGTGALNVDACRVAGAVQDRGERKRLRAGAERYRNGGEWAADDAGTTSNPPHTAGRWPTNVVLSHAQAPDGGDACADGCVDGCPVAELDAQSGVTTSQGGSRGASRKRSSMEGGVLGAQPDVQPGFGDSGGASRYFPTFRYQAKAPTRERPKVDGVGHPTVKPLALMRWLVRLVTPPGGLVLDPFAGSGTTGEACALEGFDCVLIERESAYLPLIEARLSRVEGVA